jgi:hypothetical protein
MELIMRSLIIKTALTVIFLVLLSCSQKYDGSGIFDPDDPDFHASFSTVILENDTVSFGTKSLNDGYIYAGTDINGTDTTAFAESVFKVDLPVKNDSLISAYIIYNINSTDPLITGKQLEIYKTETDWSDSTAENTDFYSSLHSYGSVNITSADSSVYRIRIDLDADSLLSWAENDTTTDQTESFYIKSPAGNAISPIIKMYSSKWGYKSLRPKLYAEYSYPDTLTATDGSDSVVTVNKLDSTFISDDISLVKKRSSCLDLSGDRFKLGGISGESYLCRIALPDSISTSSTVITGRLELTEIFDESDPVYGGISNSVSTNKELFVYIMTDSLWYSSEKKINYDTLNVWTYKLNLSDSLNYLVMDGPVQKWISEPEKNFGFLITSKKNWGSPFGSSVFLKPRLNVSYITTEE